VVGLSRFVAVLLVTAALATTGGVLFAVIHGGTTITRAVALGFWIAAAAALAGMAGSASNHLARWFNLPFIEGWLFVTAAVVLTGIGMVVDVLGT
jgi:hypothetical protein